MTVAYDSCIVHLYCLYAYRQDSWLKGWTKEQILESLDRVRSQSRPARFGHVSRPTSPRKRVCWFSNESLQFLDVLLQKRLLFDWILHVCYQNLILLIMFFLFSFSFLLFWKQRARRGGNPPTWGSYWIQYLKKIIYEPVGWPPQNFYVSSKIEAWVPTRSAVQPRVHR